MIKLTKTSALYGAQDDAVATATAIYVNSGVVYAAENNKKEIVQLKAGLLVMGYFGVFYAGTQEEWDAKREELRLYEGGYI